MLAEPVSVDKAAPGAHEEGAQALRVTDGFGNRKANADLFYHDRLVAAEAPAGSVIFFGSLLVHRSLPNRSDADRRALLNSYQPAGLPHAAELAAGRKLEVANRLASHPKVQG